MHLIITEKDIAARRIAEILSGGTAKSERRNDINVYSWSGHRCIGLSGHVVTVDFPPEYEDWRDVEPVELIDATIEKRPIQQGIVRTVQQMARHVDAVTIATDYDREGELIGKEAFELVREVNEDVDIDRVRFSSITENEVTRAFNEPDSIDFDLAAAGEARQIIDLIWGAALTRFLSLAARQLGDNFISVGRVQSPTLKLIVDREREISAFEPEDYWELFADAVKDNEEFEAQYFYLDDDDNEAERIWDEDTAVTVYESLSAVSEADVTSVSRRTRVDHPPPPFNTTQYIRAAGSIGFSAQRSMSIAEDLYTAGYITYPRTDNTVYPTDLDPRSLLATFQNHRVLGDDASTLLQKETITPTAGDEETTDHPPIHPTDELPNRRDLSDAEWRIYELIVRRFFATVADSAEWAHLRVVLSADGNSLKANGKRLTKPGYHEVYPYFKTDENYVPAVEEGERLPIRAARMEEKQTQPPRRYGQSRLIETMEKLGLGTKSTRHSTLQKLYDRGYLEDDPPRPTGLAQAVVEAAEEYADRVVSDAMTAQLEADMAAIAQGEATLDDVTDESREMLERVFVDLIESREEIGRHIQESLKADRTLGACPECTEVLLLRRSRRGSHFIGCDGYPDCRYTLPLPNTGDPIVLEDRCEDHGLRHVKMLAGRNTFVHGCPQCAADEAEDEADRIIGDCPECAATDGGELAIKRLRNGSRLVGCVRYPDCDYSLPLPRRGEIEVTETICDEHDLPELVVHNGDEPWELGCPICNFIEYQAREGGQSNGLRALDGIGAKTADKLAEAGIESVDDLKQVEPEALAASIEGISEDRVRKWQAQA